MLREGMLDAKTKKQQAANRSRSSVPELGIAIWKFNVIIIRLAVVESVA